MDRRQRNLTKLARKYGLRLQRRGSGHIAFVDEYGAVVAVTGSSPSCPRAQKNLEKDLQRRAA